MSQALPANLINISIADFDNALSQGLDFTTTESILTIWKFYSTSSSFDDDPSSVRSRNLFWRLLNSPEKARNIGNLGLTRLWRRLQNDEAFVPIRLPESFVLKKPVASFRAASTGSRSSTDDERQYSETAGSSRRRTETGASSRTTRREPEELAASYERNNPSPGRSGSGIVGGTGRPGLRRNLSSRNRGPVVATAGKARTRPSLARRRSSQTRSQTSTAQVSPRPALKSPSPQEPLVPVPSATLGERPRDMPIRSSEPMFALPSASSWQSVDDGPGQVSISSSATIIPQGSLVDRDFRRAFVDTQKQRASATNLAALGRSRKSGSMVRFEEIPEVIGSRKGKERQRSPEGSDSEARPQHKRTDSQAISDSEDSEGIGIPRVQSNLSKLIKDERKHSGGKELPPVKVSRETEEQRSASKKKEEEILEMGRKAAAPVIPRGRPGSNLASRMRSPSPGATF